MVDEVSICSIFCSFACSGLDNGTILVSSFYVGSLLTSVFASDLMWTWRLSMCSLSDYGVRNPLPQLL